jgi:subtilisin family serine protease
VKWDIPSIEASYRGNQGGPADHNYNWHDAIHDINPMHNDSIVAPENNPCGLDSRVPCDDNKHGTHTVGTMTGEDGDTKIGMAPEAQWIACRCMERGYGTLQTYVECFEWFLAPTDLDGNSPQPNLAPDVINNSWHCPEIEGCNPSNFDIMERAVDNLKAAGIMVVVSAGNDGPNCSTIKSVAPIFENSFTIGATNRRDSITGFSSRGPVLIDSSYRIKPNVSAPGQGVKSQLPDSSYANWNGTSMAAPHVSGLVALIISANPELRGEVDLIEDIIESTAVPKTLYGEGCDADSTAVPNNIYGYGRINALAAVEKALSLISTSDSAPDVEGVNFISPFGQSLLVSWSESLGVTKAELLSISGHHIIQMDVSRQSQIHWSTGHLSPGIYILKLHDANTGRMIKLIKH